MSNYKIVCVDDELDFLDMQEGLIETYGYKVVSFSNPIKAISYIEENKKEILIICSDFRMPEMTGFEFREKLLEKELEIPFLIITGYFDENFLHESLRLKISEFITKPFKEDQFKELITKYAEDRVLVFDEEKEMITDFLEETSPMLDEIEDLILELEENPDSEMAINTYFRLLHTIKGTSSCLGLEGLATFAHKYEDLINLIKEKKQAVNGSVINVLLKGSDYLKQFYRFEKNGEEFPHDITEIVKIFDQNFSKSNDVSVQDTAKTEKTEQSSSTQVITPKEEKINISVDVLSDFLEMSGELTVLKNTIFKVLTKMIAKNVGDPNLEQLSVSMIGMHKVSSMLQNQVAEMKKVTVGSVYKPMKRVVRDSARTCHKQVKLNVTGENLRIDTSVGKLLNNVLVHMLRNSVDHGIEVPEIRVDRGKGPEGTIDLNCYESGERIVVEIIDDGNGIDSEKIKEKALEKELYSQEQLSAMTKGRVFQILFESGFSTAEKVTSVSGRGVGMDMVKSSVEEFGGRILVDSELGKGSKFLLDIPIPRSVLIIKSLMVYSNSVPYNIPLDDVDHVVLYTEAKEDATIQDIEGKKLLSYNDMLIPLIELRDILKIEPRDESKEFNIVIVRSDDYCYGIVVDEIEDIEEIVVKKLAHPLNKVELFQGVTFVGDGELGLILNLQGIADSYGIVGNHLQEVVDIKTNIIEKEYMQFNLMGHDGYAIPLEYVYRLEDIKTSDIEFSGDLALLRYRDGTLPLVSLEEQLKLEEFSVAEFLNDKEVVDVIVIDYCGELRGLLIHEICDIVKTAEEIDSGIKYNSLFLGTIFVSDKTITVIDIDSLMHKLVPAHIVQDEKESDQDIDSLDEFSAAS